VFKLLLALSSALLFAFLAVAGAGAADNARVRVLHASPDAPAVDVYVDGTRVLAGVPFKAASGYLSVPAGSHTFAVRPAGADAASNPVLSASADLEAGKDYTVAAVDTVSQIKARVFVDDNAVPSAAKAHVRLVHASPDAPAVDVAVKNGTVLVPNLAFGEQKGPLPVDAGAYDLELRLAGTSNVALPLDGVRLEAGKVYTFVATGLVAGNPGLDVLPLSYTPMTPPAAGDAGLLVEAEDGGNRYLPWLLAGSAAVLLGGLVATRLATVAVRIRK
jgi:hypothetical protein